MFTVHMFCCTWTEYINDSLEKNRHSDLCFDTLQPTHKAYSISTTHTSSSRFSLSLVSLSFSLLTRLYLCLSALNSFSSPSEAMLYSSSLATYFLFRLCNSFSEWALKWSNKIQWLPRYDNLDLYTYKYMHFFKTYLKSLN